MRISSLSCYTYMVLKSAVKITADKSIEKFEYEWNV